MGLAKTWNTDRIEPLSVDLFGIKFCHLDTMPLLTQMSALVVFEVVTPTEVSCRVAAIEKWTAVADICRCLHNFNGVLQICSAFTSASAFRLKSTWAKIGKSVRCLGGQFNGKNVLLEFWREITKEITILFCLEIPEIQRK